jgi:hypothetical protein
MARFLPLNTYKLWKCQHPDVSDDLVPQRWQPEVAPCAGMEIGGKRAMVKNPVDGMQGDEHQTSGRSDYHGRFPTSARLAPNDNSINIQSPPDKGRHSAE